TAAGLRHAGAGAGRMTRRAVPVLAIAAALLAAAPGAAPQSGAPIPAGAEKAYTALASRFDRAGALDVVRFMDQYWRLAGNPGFNASIDHILDRLVAAGFSTSPGGRGIVRIDEFPNSGRGWDYRIGTLAFDDGPDPILLSREKDRVSLAINSVSTPEGGLRARLVDVGAGREADFAGKDVTGAVV